MKKLLYILILCLIANPLYADVINDEGYGLGYINNNFLNLSGSNANQNISIGTYDFTCDVLNYTTLNPAIDLTSRLKIDQTVPDVCVGTFTFPTVNFGSTTGVSATAVNGVLTLAGIGGTYNENLRFDFESSGFYDEIIIDSGTDVDYVYLNISGSNIGGLRLTSQPRALTFGNKNPNETLTIGGRYAQAVIGVYDSLYLCNRDDVLTGWGHSDLSNPVLYIQSADQTQVDDYIAFYHDQTNAILTWGNGNLWFTKSDSKYTLWGAAGDVGFNYDGTNSIWANLVGTGYMSFGMQLLALDKIMLTQTDGNEYIDSFNDGYVDIGATTAIRNRSSVHIVGNYTLSWLDNTYTTTYAYLQGNSSNLIVSAVNVPLQIQYGVLGSSVGASLSTTGDWIFNYDNADADFSIYKNTAGVAYTYNAGTDRHTFSGLMNLSGVTSDPGSLSNGDMWRRSDLGDELRYRANGVTYKFMVSGV